MRSLFGGVWERDNYFTTYISIPPGFARFLASARLLPEFDSLNL